ncbi:hypothetical protein CBS13152_11463 [Aspergillus niger]|nr:hypothetical protein CBS13152_11463 [Aspergillus niger]
MGIIGHWISPEFDKRDELLEFTEINGPHSGENLADVVLNMLDELDIAPKLLTITGDNAGNNGTLCDSLHDQLLKKYDNDDDCFRIRPLMRFRGRQSFIPCLAHILNLICRDVLASLRAGSAREAKAILDDMAIHSRAAAFNSLHTHSAAKIGKKCHPANKMHFGCKLSSDNLLGYIQKFRLFSLPLTNGRHFSK